MRFFPARYAEGRGIGRRELCVESREIFRGGCGFLRAQFFASEALAQHIARVGCVIGHRADVAAYRGTVPHRGEGVRHTFVIAVNHDGEQPERKDEHGARSGRTSRIERAEQMRSAHSVHQRVICEEERNVDEIKRVARRQQRENGIRNVVNLPREAEIVQREEVGVKAHMQQIRDRER